MKKLFTILILGILLINFTSAFEFDNVKDFSNNPSPYGKIKIINAFGLGDDLAEYTLTYNTDQCLINCYAEGTAILYSEDKLFSDLNFKDKKGNFKNLKSSKILIEVTEDYQIEVNDYEDICEVLVNGSEICNQNLIGTHFENRTKTYWKEYDGKKLFIGEYKWRIEGQKNIDERIDWIASAFGEDLTEWAWWDSDWNKKQQLNFTAGKVINTIFLNWSEGMNSNFSDLRFINSSEGLELNYTIRNKLDGNWSLISINSLGESSIWTYYENSLASSNSNVSAVYLNPIGLYYLDGVTGNATDSTGNKPEGAQIVGCTRGIDGVVNNSFDFDPAGLDRIDTYYGYNFSTQDFSINAFGNFTDFSSARNIVGGSGLNGYTFYIDTSGRLALSKMGVSATQSTGTITTGTFYGVGLGYDGANADFYVDGNLDSSPAYSATFEPNVKIYIGSAIATDFMKGTLDEVIFHERLLSDTEFEYLHNSTETDYTLGSVILGNTLAVNLISPEDNFNTTSSNITFTGNCTDDIGCLNQSLIINGIINHTIYNTTSQENITFLKDVNFADGNYTWNLEACDEETCRTGTARNFRIDSSLPQINLIEPRGQIDSFIFGNNLTINWTVSDSNLESCWFDYNNINTSVICSANNYSFTPIVNFQNLTLYANDSLGNENSNFTSWNYAFVENNATFNETSQETSRESFILNLSTDINILSISGILDYNGTAYISETSCVSGDCILSNIIDISLVESGESELHNFFWNFTIFNGTGSTNIITSTRTQNVSRIYLEECNATFPVHTLNFTTFDEQNLSRISPFSFNGAFEFWTGSGTIRRNNSFSKNVTAMELCLQPNVTMSIDATIDYDETANTSIYTSRFYYFDDFSISNVLQQIQMFLLRSTESTSFILKVQDENLLAVDNALIEIHRYYPGTNSFEIVQIAQTDDNGQSIGFFQTETVDYKFIIKKDGETLLETDRRKVIPETSPFTLTFNTGADLGEPWETQNDIPLLNSTLMWNSTSGNVNYVYVDNSGNFTQARLLVQRQSLTNSTAYTTICNDTSVLSSSSITCNVGNTSGFYIASSFITRAGEGLDLQINFQIEDFSSTSGLLGLFFGSIN